MDTDKSVPTHIGYILDGNRRWAKKHGLPPYEGHLAGYASLKDIVLYTLEQPGVEFVSIYVFSTENWKRPEKEVATIMKLAMRVFKSELKEFIKRGIRIRVLGIEEGLTEELITAAREAEKATEELTNGTLCVCFNYGGQQEIVDAVQTCIKEGVEPTVEGVTDHLYAPDIPPIDMVVRTSGEQRISNFMIWRTTYSEFLFLNKYWPDMTKDDVREIIAEFDRRQRRFGK